MSEAKHTPGPNAHLSELLDVLKAIATALDGTRNRFGKFEVKSFAQLDPLRLLAMKYGVARADDTMDQVMHVARAAITKAEGKTQ